MAPKSFFKPLLLFALGVELMLDTEARRGCGRLVEGRSTWLASLYILYVSRGDCAAPNEMKVVGTEKAGVVEENMIVSLRWLRA